MKKISYFLFIVALLPGCTKNKVDVGKVIFNLQISDTTTLADGQTMVEITAELDPKSDPSKRNIVFKTSSGTFGSSPDKSVTVKADFENTLLIARTRLKMPLDTGTIIITAKPEGNVAYGDFIITDSIIVSPSVPSSINLEASSISVLTGYLSEVQLIGVLKNFNGKFVSKGNKVEFKDYFMDNTEVHGSYRALQTSSDDASKVSCFYSPGFLAPGTRIYVRCLVYDKMGLPTNISDTVYINVNQ